MISRSTIDRIYQAAIIEDVVGEFVQLKKSGSAYKGLSPFANEKTPSFFVVPSLLILFMILIIPSTIELLLLLCICICT